MSSAESAMTSAPCLTISDVMQCSMSCMSPAISIMRPKGSSGISHQYTTYLVDNTLLVSTVYKRNAVYPFRKYSMEKVSCVFSKGVAS